VEEELVKVWSAVQVLALPRLRERVPLAPPTSAPKVPEYESEPLVVMEVVATVPKLEFPVQYVRLPVVGAEEVENWLLMVMEEPRATEPPPERPVPAFTVMLLLVRPVLLSVPVQVGVKVRAPEPGITVWPMVSPLKLRVEVEKVTLVAVVEA
jgi:hypothetical protein